ncbi:MAG TPA: hypothetical protein VGX48_20395 [Pyrinomonadaceae bacterium]|nr:hypothetical protein [Pyrinomonadaceae bacterium]
MSAFLMTTVLWGPVLAASAAAEDTDTRMVDARVVEVNDRHISVVARTGVEHVIATDAADTNVTREGKRVALKNLKVGDVVTVELDEQSQLKFARHISISAQAGADLASAKP